MIQMSAEFVSVDADLTPETTNCGTLFIDLWAL